MNALLAFGLTVALAHAGIEPPAQGGIQLPDPTKGQIDGKQAILYWPHGPGRTLLPATGCEAHLVPSSNLDEELVYPCGVWFLPPVGRYKVWLEQGETMSPAPFVSIYSGGAFRERGAGMVAPVVPAGRVRALPNRKVAEGQHLRLVHVDSHRWEGGFGRILDRRVSAGKVAAGVLMPAGEVIGGFFQGDDAAALSRPVSVRAGAATEIWPEPPANGADILVVLTRSPGTTKDDSTPLLVLEGETPRSADVLISGVDRIVGVWYGLEARSARLTLSSESSFIPEEELTLRSGKVTTFRGRLQPRPSLDVRVIAPDDLDEELEVEVDASGKVRHAPVSLTEVTTIENLPAEPLRVMLKAGKWRFYEQIDLSDGIDGSVTFELKPVIVSGTVYRGRDPSPDAGMEFQTGRDLVVTTRTDSDGQYRMTLWREGYYPVLITLPGVTGPPAFELVSVVDGKTLDFHFPDNEYLVRVVDATNGEAIPGAGVSVDQTSGDRSSSQRVAADQDGTVVLPPLSEGTLTLSASAAGFRASEPRQFTIGPEAGNSEIVLRLEREQKAHEFRVLLSTGAPASNADAWLVLDGALIPFWEGKAGADGSLALPAVDGPAVLLLRHPEAGSVAQRFHGAASEQVLPPASPPLRARVELRGGKPVRAATIAILLDEARLFGPSLAFFAWSRPLADAQGVWTGTNLPPRPLRLLAWTPTATAAQTGGFDSMATSVPYPWPDELRITALE